MTAAAATTLRQGEAAQAPLAASNTLIWDGLKKTDPAYTKKFKRSGGFEGTAISPMHVIQKMTAVFGPVGIGWGLTRPEYEIISVADERMVFCEIGAWYVHPITGLRSETFWGSGGDFIVKGVGRDNSYRLVLDDEGKKKATTDATGNALKLLGMSADVFLGLFDDSKYVNQTEREFAAKRGQPAAATPASPPISVVAPKAAPAAAVAPGAPVAGTAATPPPATRPQAAAPAAPTGSVVTPTAPPPAGEPGGGRTPEPVEETEAGAHETDESATWDQWVLETEGIFATAASEDLLLDALAAAKPNIRILKGVDIALHNKLIACFRIHEQRTRAIDKAA